MSPSWSERIGVGFALLELKRRPELCSLLELAGRHGHGPLLQIERRRRLGSLSGTGKKA